MTSPHHFGLRAATGLGDEQANLATKGKISSDDRHATGVTDVYGDAIRSAATIVLFPLNLKPQAGNSALMRSEF